MNRVRLFYDGIAEVMSSAKVKAALRAEAERIAARAAQIGDAENTPIRTRIVDGHQRLHNRPYARVLSADVDQEFGSWAVQRRRILGRASDTPAP